MKRLSFEPTLILAVLNAGWNAAQLVALPMPTWAHATVLAVSAMLTALANRALVTPTAKLAAQSSPAPATGDGGPAERLDPGQWLANRQEAAS